MTFTATESFLNLHGEKRALKRKFLARKFIRVFKTNRVKIQFLLAFDILSDVSSPGNLLTKGLFSETLEAQILILNWLALGVR